MHGHCQICRKARGKAFFWLRRMTVFGDKLPDGENRSPSSIGQFSAIHEAFQGRAAAVRNFEFQALACRQNLVPGMAFLMA